MGRDYLMSIINLVGPGTKPNHDGARAEWLMTTESRARYLYSNVTQMPTPSLSSSRIYSVSQGELLFSLALEYFHQTHPSFTSLLFF